ncbi:MAG: hypothetical protein P1S59_14635, partial [bacterium]|nr:hypothetical protein [bacterium]
VTKLGLSGSFRYLIPILFPEEILPTILLDMCRNAIEMRNTVVHQGQFKIHLEKLRTYLASIREVCEIFLTYTYESS